MLKLRINTVYFNKENSIKLKQTLELFKLHTVNQLIIY